MEKEMERIKGALEDFGRKVAEVIRKGAGETGRVARMAQIRLEINALEMQRLEMCEELGELFYENYRKPSKGAGTELSEVVAHIAHADQRLASLRRKLKAARTEPEAAVKPARRGRPPKAAAAKKPARRGRPPKAKAAAAAKKPARRGRPPKAAAEKKQARRGRPLKAAAKPVRRGRPPKAAAAKKPARRGRPPKAAAAVKPARRGRPPKAAAKARKPRKPAARKPARKVIAPKPAVVVAPVAAPTETAEPKAE